MSSLRYSLLTFAALAALVHPGFAQNGERRATLTGDARNNSGKCTIEVSVDGSAEIEIRGDRGLLRTIDGQPAQWRRFVCSGPLPANPGDFQFVGVDGRGRQELVQDPRNTHGAAVVRIQDREGGAEAYTFDLTWREGGYAPVPTGQTLPDRRDRISPNNAMRSCQDAVRESASRQYGLRDINFRTANADDNPGRNDSIAGSFEVRRGNSDVAYRFSCAINMADGMVRGVEISQDRGQGMRRPDRPAGRGYAISDCERAIQQRIERDGYRDVQFNSLELDARRNEWIGGSAKAQRGIGGREYNFQVGCSINSTDGTVKSVQINRR
jgi:hypothetical protein